MKNEKYEYKIANFPKTLDHIPKVVKKKVVNADLNAKFYSLLYHFVGPHQRHCVGWRFHPYPQDPEASSGFLQRKGTEQIHQPG